MVALGASLSAPGPGLPYAKLVNGATDLTQLLDLGPAMRTEGTRRPPPQVCATALHRVSRLLTGSQNNAQRRVVAKDDRFTDLVECTRGAFLTAPNPPGCSGSDVVLHLASAIVSLALMVVETGEAKEPRIRAGVEALVGRFLTEMEPGEGAAVPLSTLTRVEWACRMIGLGDASRRIAAMPRLTAAHLPFQVLRGATKGLITLEDVRREVPFNADMLTTRSGKKVKERRETCWMAEPGIGGLAYSGKIMAPVAFTPAVAALRDELMQEHGVFFDCALINWYPDGEAACKYHSDPEHGTFWGLDTVVVSMGEARRFCFREVADAGSSMVGEEKKETETEPHMYHLHDGDCVWMFGDCQERFQHAVLRAENLGNMGPRVSVVFKKSIPSPSGKRGHGLGRRGRGQSGGGGEDGESGKKRSEVSERATRRTERGGSRGPSAGNRKRKGGRRARR